MESLYVLIPLALVFCFASIGALLWSIHNRQYQDLDREASRILEHDDDK